MNKITFLYEAQFNSSDPLPTCKISIYGKSDLIPVHVLVDTGAEYTVLPINVAMDAGFNIPYPLKPCVRYGGSITKGAKIKTYFDIGGRKLCADVMYVETLALPYGLLGRKGVFDEFNEVAFSERPKCHLVEFRW